MGYMKIPNLYKAQEILEFKQLHALEKIHGSSANVSWDLGRKEKNQDPLHFRSGGAKHSNFILIFDEDELRERFTKLGLSPIIIFGEAYGGKMQGMSNTYGKELQFIAFDVKVGHSWLSVPGAEGIVLSLGLEFVSYNTVSSNLEDLDKERDAPSVQAVRNGCGEDHKREGVVLRPPFEVRKNNGERVIAKYKTEEFRETTSPRKVSKDEQKILSDAEDISKEWVTEMRLTHVIGQLNQSDPVGMEQLGTILKLMGEDVKLEAGEEVVLSKAAKRAINRRTARLFKQRLQNSLKDRENV